MMKNLSHFAAIYSVPYIDYDANKSEISDSNECYELSEELKQKVYTPFKPNNATVNDRKYKNDNQIATPDPIRSHTFREL